ncbi:CehA/McbA family metallohydrolase [Flammeovirga sp. SJP92]|uniref:CehA/McbA family metallohydrolase n=1 Tax=Flammeovirga sp. SJP92 TaxID=1775430 RepID=UPI0012F99439|nr:CehA/McbA family metallohydrolase [Flammeovirga sp. SJP92]
MKKLLLSFCLLFTLPLMLTAHQPDNASGTFELDWHTYQIDRTIATGVFQTMGLRVDNDPSRAGVKEVGGEKILYGIALGFSVDDQFAFDIDQKVKVTVELDASNLTEFFYAYDRNGVVESVHRVEIAEGTKGFQKYEFVLERARFANRGYSKTDFALSAGLDMSNKLLFIRDIKFELIGETAKRNANGNLQLSLFEKKSKERVAAQIGLYDVTGRMPLPTESAIELQFFETKVRSVEIREELDQVYWPSDNHYTMYIDGFYQANIPAGKYTLIVMKGPEYPILQKEIEIKAGKNNPIEIQIEHVLDMPKKGWYSGDVHNHFSRRNATANPNQIAHARAADLHMHWLYALGNSVTTHFDQYAWGKEGQYKEKDYFIASGQEDPRTDFLGHVLAMGHDEFVRYPNEYFHYDKVSKEVHKQGGVFGVAHMDFAQFQQNIALAMLAPENEVDFVEIFQYHSLNLNDWYAFLNLGFKLSAAAGSDWPYMSLPGAVRTFVKVDGEFTPDAWNKALKDGKSFVSNGPMIDFNVNGQDIGSTLQVKKGETLSIKAKGYIVPSWDLLQYASIIVNGDVVKEIKLEKGQKEVFIELELPADKSCWIAVKVHGEKSHDIVFQSDFTKRIQAHTSPIYIEVDGQPTWSEEKAPQIIDMLLKRLEQVKEMKYERHDNEAWESPDRTEEMLDAFRPYLRTWIDQTKEYYINREKEIVRP